MLFFAVGDQVLIITNADLYDATPIEYGVSNRLEPLHLVQRLQYSRVFHIHQSEGCDVHRVVLEVLQVERLYILRNQSACSLDTLCPLSVFTAIITTRTLHRVFQKDLNIFYSGHRGHRT